MEKTPVGDWGGDLLDSVLSEIDGISGAAQKLTSTKADSIAETGGLLINISAKEGYDRSDVDKAKLKIQRRLKELGVESDTADNPNRNTHEWEEDLFGNQQAPYVEIYTQEITGKVMRRSNV